MKPTTRRNLLIATGATALAATATTAGVTWADTDNTKPKTYVFVHGTNSYSGFWTPYARELQYRGHRTIAIDQPHHGAGAYIPRSYHHQDLDALATEPTPLGDITLDDFTHNVTKAIRRAATTGPVILVGHSMGGASITTAANAVPQHIAHICYMAAYCCSKTLPTINACMSAPEADTAIVPADLVIGDPEKLGVNRYNFLGADDDNLRMLKKMAWNGNSDTSFRAGLLTMQPDESAHVPEQKANGDRDTWGTIPRTYLRFANDNLITARLQDRMIADADKLTPDNPFTVHNFKAPHFGPEKVGGIVDALENLG